MKALIGLATVVWTAATAVHGQSSFYVAEVRQLVTFRWAERVPFGARPAMDTLVEVYRQTPAVLRLRGFQEAESPEPFDLILMTSYRGLEGFELARKQMGSTRTRDGRMLAVAYQRLDEMSEWHRDEFVEMLRDHDYRTGTEPRLLVFEWVRLVRPRTAPTSCCCRPGSSPGNASSPFCI